LPRSFGRAFPPDDESQQPLSEAETLGKERDRLVRRHLWASARLRADLDWPGAAQVYKLERVTQRKGRETTEVEYAISSVSRDRGNASDLLSWWRGHWGIENQLHWVRDATFGEDHSRIRTGHAPEIFAALRNAAISVLRLQNVTNVAAALRHYVHRVADLLKVTGILKH
jgi:predicted transposase YbfD/YdcC